LGASVASKRLGCRHGLRRRHDLGNHGVIALKDNGFTKPVMRIKCASIDFKEFTMPVAPAPVRKRPVNLTLSDALVAQAKTYTNNLSATMESLLTEFVAQQQQAQRSHQYMVDVCVSDWNQVAAACGSFADEHVNL